MPHEHTDERRSVVDELIAFLTVEADRQALRQRLKDTHPADIAEALDDLPDETRHAIMETLDLEQRVEVLDEVDEPDVDEFVEEAPVHDLAELVDAMPPDEAADMLAHADEEKIEAIMARLAPDLAEDLRELREYEPDTAGGIMTTEFSWVTPDQTAEQIRLKLKEEHEELETVHEIFVCRDDKRLKGIIRVADLIAAEPDQTASQLMDRATITVRPLADQEICARYMAKYDLAVLPVVDLGRRMLGIITPDDILEVMEDEASEDMYRLAGVGDPLPLQHGAVVRAYRRLPWLVATLLGMGLVTPLIMHRWFQNTLEQVVVLAFFIPAIMGLGGNAAIQSSTITVRGLAMGEIEWKDTLCILRRELSVGIMVALVCTIVIGGFAYGVFALGFSGPASHSVGRVALVVAIAMFCGVLTSVLLGTLVPMLCHRAGVDPAMAAGPFITTLIDIGTQTLYLGLATWMLLG